VTRLKQFVALTGLTAVEILRQPVSLLLFATTVVLMGLSPLLLLHNFGESGKMVRDGALALHMLLGFAIASYSACSVMAREVRTGTASSVLSKPVERSLFFLSKYAGVLLVVAFYSLCATSGTLLAEKACEKFHFSSRIVGYFADYTSATILLLCPALACVVGAIVNLRTKRPFVTSAFTTLAILMILAVAGSCFINEQGQLQSFFVLYDFRLLAPSLLIFMGLAVATAIAMLFSVKLNVVPAMSAVAVLFMIGWMTQYFLGSRADSSLICAVLYGILPDWQHFWMGDALSDGGVVSLRYLLHAGSYTVLYGGGLIALGATVFSNSEMK
jgi:hypothetical protein